MNPCTAMGSGTPMLMGGWGRSMTRMAIALMALATGVVWLGGVANAAEAKQPTFESPEVAVSAMVDAIRAKDHARLATIIGPGSRSWLFSGDMVTDRAEIDRFVVAYDQKHAIVSEGANRAVLRVGKDDWPMPVPLVKATRWRFDTAAGREETLARRVGRNELYTIDTIRAIADAQVEYARLDRQGSGLLEYAQKFRSSPGKKDGLYWPVKPAEAESPLGPLVARAAREGYKTGLQPYHGYIFRILKSQGKDAPGGAYSYVVKQRMIGGFGVVAYPANYGVSGVMTFLINQDGVVYQKNLGPDTAQVAAKLTSFNPGKGWDKTP
jgi:hypothetical protein